MTTPWYHLNHANGILVAIHPRILCPGGRSNIARLTIFLPMMSPYITIEMRMKYPMNAVMKYILSSTYVVLPKWKLVRAMILIAILSAPPNSSKYPQSNAIIITIIALMTIGAISPISTSPLMSRTTNIINDTGIATYAAGFQYPTGMRRDLKSLIHAGINESKTPPMTKRKRRVTIIPIQFRFRIFPRTNQYFPKVPPPPPPPSLLERYHWSRLVVV